MTHIEFQSCGHCGGGADLHEIVLGVRAALAAAYERGRQDASGKDSPDDAVKP